MPNISKLMNALLSDFEFELAGEKEKSSAGMVGSASDIPELISVGISDLAWPLFVRASKRTRVIS
jgi:hypothetical protein